MSKSGGGGGGGGGAVAPAPCPPSPTPLLWHLASLHHANGGQFLHQPVHDHYQPFLIYSDLKIDS